jgi:hypothetical protein
VIDLPPELPIDRIGALDGAYVPDRYAFRVPLPATDRTPAGNDVHKFLTAAEVRAARAAITPPWFGRRGGGIRFTLQQPETGLRDLVVSGRLQRIQIIEAQWLTCMCPEPVEKRVWASTSSAGIHVEKRLSVAVPVAGGDVG